MYRSIKEIFSRKFASWSITVSDEDLFLGNKKRISKKGLHLSWIIQENEKGIYIEYYGIHDRRGHLHGRIYNNGSEEDLEILKGYVAYSPNIPGDREKRTIEFESYNKKLMRELKQKGLIEY